jgi:TetR/AcrR family transcriptional repressor of bet genes
MGKNLPIRSTRRRELIEATISIIARYGYSGTTVSRVAKAAGVSIGLMNFHFESKDKLFKETFKYLADDYHQVWMNLIMGCSDDPWDRLIKTMIGAYFDPEVFTSEKLAVWFSFWSDAALRDNFRNAATRVEHRYIRDLEGEIYRLVQHRADGKKTAARITGALSAMIDGYWLQALIYPKTFKSKDAVRSCIAFLEVCALYYEGKTAKAAKAE